MIVLLSGGTGTPKLLQGLMRLLPQEEISVVVNTAEDTWLPHGYFSPDMDTVLYTLAGIIDDEAWHGIKGDTYHTHHRLLSLGYPEALRIGDLDRATHIYRGVLMNQGCSLSEATESLRRAFGVKGRVYPMSDDPVETVIETPDKKMSFQEFWVEKKGAPGVTGVSFRGVEKARGCPGALKAIRRARGVIIGPSNPVSSILPIVSIPDIRRELRARRNRIAISPIIRGRPVSGPADKFMRALGMEPCSRAVAELYREFLDFLVVDAREKDFSVKGVKLYRTNTLMKSLQDKISLAEFTLRVLNIS
jgi:LPPG:FO 2-phospho-L-lactate transferase